MIKLLQEKIASHNRWAIFDVGDRDINDMVSVLNGISNKVFCSVGAKKILEVQRTLPQISEMHLCQFQDVAYSLSLAIDHGKVTRNAKEKFDKSKAMFWWVKIDWENSCQLDCIRVGKDVLSNNLRSAWTYVYHLI